MPYLHIPVCNLGAHKMKEVDYHRSGPPEVFWEKRALKISQCLQESARLSRVRNLTYTHLIYTQTPLS